MAIPTGPVVPTLNTLNTAFWGALFFTLSIGTGLTLATWAALYLWDRLFQRQRIVIGILAVCWLALLGLVNSSGMVLFPSLFVFLVPLVTALSAIKRRPPESAVRHRHLWIVPFVILVMLTGLWATQLNKGLFITIRDHILLSNALGRTVNDFYYRYTLYAAEAFKSFHQKTLRTCRLAGVSDARLARRLESLLAKHDVLLVAQLERPDLLIGLSDNRMVLASAGNDTIEVALSQFLSEPNRWLQEFSKARDHKASFRKFVLLGLLLGFPILLYVVVYGILRAGMGFFLKEPVATLATAGLCLLIGILLFIPMLGGRPMEIAGSDIDRTLTADNWPQRVAVLRQIEKQKLDIAKFPQYRRLLDSQWVVERYWLARVLAHSRKHSTYEDLIYLLNDPHPNVVCQVYYALGRRGNSVAIDHIKAQMAGSDHWYAQWYGYRAMRRLGWRQTRSN